ncbi:MAG TPA: alpha/beta family hydrolase [Candidatus Binatia bacterium]|nr:alpha/beta family hydrolase [Candidatus Binatia bacterium]
MRRAAVTVEAFEVPAADLPAVRGFLHRPAAPVADAIVLTHGAGSDCRAPLLVDLADGLAAAGRLVLRCDLPFRQARPHGPPSPAGAERDRMGLRHAAQAVRGMVSGRLILSGLSYGGRQASVLAAEEPALADALVLLAYPLHPPARPGEWRTEHFSRLRTPTLFVHGTHDPFGSLEELERARSLIPARTELLVVRGSHDLGYSCSAPAEGDLPGRVCDALDALVRGAASRPA